MRLTGKRAWIAGGGGHIGRALALRFAEEGADILLQARRYDTPELRMLAEKIDRIGTKLIVTGGDLVSETDMDSAVRRCEQELGGLDILVACAGLVRNLPIDEMTISDWQQVLDSNLTSTFFACKYAVSLLRKNGGSIVAFSSIGGRTSRPSVGVNYAAAKAGVDGLVIALATETGRYGIRVNGIAPGPMEDSPMFNTCLPDDKRKALTDRILLPRGGKTEDAVNAALFLASDESSWITGQILDVNGGLYVG